MSLDSNLIHRCTIDRPYNAPLDDEYGQGVDAWVKVYEDAMCRLIEKTKPVLVSDRIERAVVATYTLLVPPSIELQARDRVRAIKFEDGTTDTRVFTVRELLRRRGSVVRHRTALLSKVE